MPYSITGTTLQIYDKTLNGLALTATIDSGTIPTTISTFAPGCMILDLSTGIRYYNSGTTAAPVWSQSGSSALADAQMMKLIQVDVTAAQMIATTAGSLSHANGLIVVPAAAAGYVNILHRLVVSYTFSIAAFTGGGNTTVNIGSGGAALTGLIGTASLWQSAANVIYWFAPLAVVAAPITTATSINLVTASAITNPGTAAGSSKVYCWYSTVAI